MRHDTCCVYNCHNNGKNSDYTFYKFPQASWKREQRMQWMVAVWKNNPAGLRWFPKPHDRICSAHFIGGAKADEQNSPSYVPTIFPGSPNSAMADVTAITSSKQFVGSIVKIEKNTTETSVPKISNEPSIPTCALHSCQNSSETAAMSSGVTMHRFPRSPTGPRTKWIEFVQQNREDPEWSPIEDSHLCSDHFMEHEFIYKCTGRYVKHAAVPSIMGAKTDMQIGDAAKRDVGEGAGKQNGGSVTGMGNRPTEDNPRAETDFESILEVSTIDRGASLVCAVPGCGRSARSHPDTLFIPFPAEPERYRTWLTLINRSDLAARASHEQCVCVLHFEPGDFAGLRLREGAVPRHMLPKRPYDYEAGPSGLQNVVIKKEVEFMETDTELDSQTQAIEEPQIKEELSSPVDFVMEIDLEEVKIEPESEENTKQVQFDGLPVIESVVSYDMGTGPIRYVTTETPTLSKSEIFLQNATISPVDIIHLPGIEEPFRPPVAVQTTKALVDQMIAPLKKKYESMLREMKKRVRLENLKVTRSYRSQMTEAEFKKTCDSYLGEFSDLVKSEVRSGKKSGFRGYSQELKTVIRNLSFSSPRAYKFVKDALRVPTKSTILRSQMPIRTGVNMMFVEHFKAKVDRMSAKEKLCSVCVDYIELNKNLHYCLNNDFLYGLHDIDQVVGTELASFAVLIMVKGFYTEWKQPISVAYVAEKKCYKELKDWLYKIIALLFDIGCDVKSLIVDLNSEFFQFPEQSDSKPYFEVGDRKVYLVFNVPNLFKSTRDALMKYDFQFGDNVVKWNYIKMVYNSDKEQELRLVPEVTDAHFQAESTDYKTAVQVFSHNMAAAMNAYVTAGLIPSDASETIQFIQTMNDLFDVMNSQKMSDDELKRAYTGSETQKNFLMNTLEYLKKLETLNKHGKKKDRADFAKGLLINIKSIMSLLEDLQKENFKHIMTKHFNLDCMKIYFDKVRTVGGNRNSKPTTVMFSRSLRRLFMVYLTKNAKGVSEIDLKAALTLISENVSAKEPVQTGADNAETIAPHRFLKTVSGDCLKLWPKPGPTFTGGYLLAKCLDKHICNKLIDTLCTLYKMEEAMLKTKLKEYNPKNLAKTNLLEPPAFMVKVVHDMDEIFEEYTRRVDKEFLNFGWNIYLKMEGLEVDMPCPCFPMMFLKQLFIKTRVFQMTRQYNDYLKPLKRAAYASKRKGK